MGYNSSVVGEIIAKPAIDDRLLKKFSFDDASRDGMKDLVGVSDSNETVGILPDGSIGVIGDSLTIFTLRFDDQYRADNLEDHVAALLKMCKGAKSVANGDLTIFGEENLDVWRIAVVNNVASTYRPQLVWPDGKTEQL